MCKLIMCMILMYVSTCVASTMVDPTRPAIYKSSSDNLDKKEALPVEVNWVLNSILISPQRKVAVINGKQVVEGGTIDQYQVKKIDAYEVTLSGSSGNQVLKLGSYQLEKQYRNSGNGAKDE